MKKGSMLYAMLNHKCPRCHEGDLFIYKNPYHPKKMLKMHKKCPVCGQTYTPEPGFYFGAAYISYALSSGIFIVAFVIMYFFMHIKDATTLIGTVVALAVLVAPINFRFSRSVWASIFIKYQPDIEKVDQSAETSLNK